MMIMVQHSNTILAYVSRKYNRDRYFLGLTILSECPLVYQSAVTSSFEGPSGWRITLAPGISVIQCCDVLV